MALVTGRDCSLTIAETTYDDVVNSFELAFDTSDLNYQTLSGPRAAGGSETGTLTITAAYDAGETDSLFMDLWNGAGSTITYEATVGPMKYAGNAIAVRPGATATAGEISEFSVELSLDGTPTPTPVTP